MSIAEKYYSDTACVAVYNEINDKGDTFYENEITIPCRFEFEQKETLDIKGDKVLSTASMICGMFIPPLSIVKDDLNRRFTVKSCVPVKNISGKTDHYEVTL